MIKKINYILLGLLCAIISLHFLGSTLNWYITTWWFDVLLHFMGGMWLFVCYFYLVYFSKYEQFNHLAVRPFFKTAILFVIIISILWEVFEYTLGVSMTKDNYILDTSIDLIMDVFGAIIAYLIFKE